MLHIQNDSGVFSVVSANWTTIEYLIRLIRMSVIHAFL